MLNIGDIVPNFETNGLSLNNKIQKISLNDFSGKKLLICLTQITQQREEQIIKRANLFRDFVNSINNAVVIFIFPVPIQELGLAKKFIGLNGIYLSDPHKNIAKIFDIKYPQEKNEYPNIFLTTGDHKVYYISKSEELNLEKIKALWNLV